jgi:preprotein translocase subunit Sec63
VDADSILQHCVSYDGERRLLEAARYVLGVDAAATAKEQKHAYRQLASRYHPDKLGPGATPDEREYALRRSIEIREAWETLRLAGGKSAQTPDSQRPAATGPV